MPSGRALAGVKEKVPSAPATVVPSTVPLLLMVTVEPASAVPVRAGVGSFVGDGTLKAGAAGTPVSIVTLTGTDGLETFPAASRAVAVRLAVPSTRAVGGVNEKVPLASAVVVPSTVVPLRMVTVLPASALPVIVGVVLFVGPSGAITGAVGAVRSICTDRAAEAGEALPTASRATAVRAKPPSARGVVGVKVKAPLASACAVPSTVVPLRMVTVLPASAVPVRVGVESLVRPPPDRKVGAAGGVASICRLIAAEAGPRLPAGSRAIAVRE